MPEIISRPKILIVDDTSENLNLLIEILGYNYTVVSARSGNRALQLASGNNPPEIILLDIMMPDVDGYQVCRKLKADAKTCDIPIIFLTVLNDKESELRGFNEGAVDYIHKPFSATLVQARVATHLELASSRRLLASQVKILKDAAQLRDDVDRIIRHDLKVPLTSILAYTELLLADTVCTLKQREWIQDMYESGQTMLQILNISLDVYKMEIGTYTLNAEILCLDAIIKRILIRFHPLTQRTGLKIVANLSPTVVLGEDLLCLVLFTNLIKNAIEATPLGGVIHIELSTENNQAIIHIRNPTPVPMAVRTTFFNKYATAGKPGGTGLGTYSSRLMARTMGGDIMMQTDDETGTCITVCLPIQNHCA